MRNTFGNVFTLTTFGESHGEAVGGVVDGMPAGVGIDLGFIQSELDRRRPGQSAITTSRREPDRVELLSGVFEGKATGAPIGFIVRNTNQHSQDYDNLRDLFRPSHADYTYYAKYGLRDHRGGGRSSARVTISRCVGGALAKLALRQIGVSVTAYTSQVGDIAISRDYTRYDLSEAGRNAVRCPDGAKAAEMERLIKEVKASGDTIGGVISCVIKGCPAGLGEPEFGKLHAALGAAMLGISGAVRLGAERRVHRRGRAHRHPDQPQRRHTGRHQQRRRHILPRGVQARGHCAQGAADGRQRRKQRDLHRPRTPRSVRAAQGGARGRGHGRHDRARLLPARPHRQDVAAGIFCNLISELS